MHNRGEIVFPGGLPRSFDVALAICGLVVLAPLFAVCALLVALTSAGPVIFRQERIGRDGRRFTLYKFRTMRAASTGLQITTDTDSRITWAGGLLRKTKLDEIPELWNILRGDMAFVGPRPEVPRYVDLDDFGWRRVLMVRPGLTDPVTIRLRNEQSLLSAAGGDADQFYRQVLLPWKLRGYMQYMDTRSSFADLRVLAQTLATVLIPALAGGPDLADNQPETVPGRPA